MRPWAVCLAAPGFLFWSSVSLSSFPQKYLRGPACAKLKACAAKFLLGGCVLSVVFLTMLHLRISSLFIAQKNVSILSEGLGTFEHTPLCDLSGPVLDMRCSSPQKGGQTSREGECPAHRRQEGYICGSWQREHSYCLECVTGRSGVILVNFRIAKDTKHLKRSLYPTSQQFRGSAEGSLPLFLSVKESNLPSTANRNKSGKNHNIPRPALCLPCTPYVVPAPHATYKSAPSHKTP